MLDSELLDYLIPSTKVGELVSLTILFLLAIALLSLLYFMFRILMEFYSVRKTVSMVKEGEIEHDILVSNWLKSLPESVIKQRITALSANRNMPVLAATILDRHAEILNSSNFRLPRFVMSILLVLGLLGTVLGISIAIGNILPAIASTASSVDRIAELTKLISATIAGLDTAFSTTLAALLSSFLLSIVMLIIEYFDSYVMKRIEIVTSIYVLPRVMKSSEEEAASEFLEGAKELALEIGASAKIMDSVKAAIGDIVNNLTKSTATTHENLTDLVCFVKSFENSMGSFTNYGNKVSEACEDIAKAIKDFKGAQLTEDMIKEVVSQAVMEAVSSIVEVSSQARESFRGDVKEAIVEQQTIINQATESINRNTEAISSLSNSQLIKLQEGFDAALLKFNDAFEVASNQATDRENISRMVMTEIVNHLDKLSKSLREREFIEEAI